eukprot:Seg1690.9 transcript_id=Seg1690.9/GoldUCD/mRNA.D3Y31 product="Small conductance calcium-activated potassium channel protein 3" protein_id=Seg1690.9/GoldUCD/D3Y31
MGVWKDGKSRSSMNSADKNGSQRGDSELYLKDMTVKFPESNGHHIPLEQSSSWRFGLPKKKSHETTVLEFKNLETAKSHVKGTLKKYSTILFALGAIAGFLSIIDSQITIWRRRMVFRIRAENKTTLSTLNTLDIYTGIQVSARSAISILSVTTAIYLYIYYSHVHTLAIMRNIVPPNSGFCFSKLALLFFVELIVCLIHIPPGIHIFPEEAQLIVFSRFYLIARFLKQKHKLMNSKSTRFLASVTKTDLSSVFLLKTYFMRNPFILIISTYMITVLFGGYAVYLVEKKISYVDTIWMLIVTMTTVGFGDFVPRSVTARAFIAVIAVIGIFLMALCISLVHESLQLTQQEKRILAYVENTDHYRLVKDTAARAIQYWWKYLRLLQKGRRRRSSAYHHMRIKTMRSKLYAIIVKWRTLQGEKDDYWRKEFLGDNTAMLLTDVSREVKSIKEFLVDIVQPALHPIENMAAMHTQTDASPQKGPHILPQLATRFEVPVSVQNHSAPPEAHQHLGQESYRDTMPHYSENDNILQHNRYQHTASISRSTSGVSSFRGYSMNASPDNNMKELESSIILLQNQIRLMNNNLDETYSKSKRDLKDLENLVACVVHVRSNSQIDAPLCSNCRLISQLRASSC